MDVLIFIIGVVLGGVIVYYLVKKFTVNTVSEKDFFVLKEKNRNSLDELIRERKKLNDKEQLFNDIATRYASLQTKFDLKRIEFNNLKEEFNNNIIVIQEKGSELFQVNASIAELNVQKESLETQQLENAEKIKLSEERLQLMTAKYNSSNEIVASLKAAKSALDEKLVSQKKEVEDLRKSFNLEFENIANKILEEKTDKFTSVNKINLDTILKPLGENIEKFKKQVEDVYDKESKERFSLATEIKRLEDLNGRLSKDAQNLTTALKGEAKTQGIWGEMILERILEQSGLRKGEQYRMEVVLKDDAGKNLKTEAGKSMRPDAVIDYPDDRKVIIDSKVSLTAFTRYIGAEEKGQQIIELNSHVKSVKAHIDELSAKAYDSYNKSLDFVMMFIPTESAYIAALKHDPELWNYAYVKRIILISPTNLITALKMINDLWKREDQSKNAQAIAERGALLYEKFVVFAETMQKVKKSIDSAQLDCSKAIGQLSTGGGNLVGQATKLKNLGVVSSKVIPAALSVEYVDNN